MYAAVHGRTYDNGNTVDRAHDADNVWTNAPPTTRDPRLL